MNVGRDSDTASFRFRLEIHPVDGVVEGVQVRRQRVMALVVVPGDQVRVSFNQALVCVDRWCQRPTTKPNESQRPS